MAVADGDVPESHPDKALISNMPDGSAYKTTSIRLFYIVRLGLRIYVIVRDGPPAVTMLDQAE